MTQAELTAIPADRIHECWRFIEPMIAKSCAKSRGQTTPDKVYSDLLTGDAVLWIAHRDNQPVAAGITAIDVRTDGKCCLIRHMGGGDMKSWLGHIKTIKEFARFNKCNRVEFEGRHGWKRVVAGAQDVGTIYEVQI